MLCIIAFVIFVILFPILGFFPEYRRLFKRSWSCVVKKATLQPCDINLGEELKNKLLGGFALRFPRIIKFIDKTFSFWAILFVIVNIWSISSVLLSGLNLWVWDTCNPVSSEGCSLSGEACGVASNQLDLQTAYNDNRLGEFALQPWNTLTDTVSRIPNRLKNWNATDYLSPNPTYYNAFDPSKSTAVEFIDPGCKYCKKLFGNIKSAGFEQKYNLSYTVYPIPEPSNTANDGYKFQASYTIASYMEAIKRVPLQNNKKTTPPDWQLLEILFTRENKDGQTLQDEFNLLYSKKEVPQKLEALIKEIGYNDQEIAQIRELSGSPEIKQSLQTQRNIVEQKVQTIKIPTIIFNNRRYDRVVDVETLKS
jgi:hypothetical protein